MPGNHQRYSTGGTQGFSLVELVIVLVIVGVVGVFVAPRFFQAGPFEARGFYDELVSAARYAQRLAIATQCPVQVAIDGTTDHYALYFPDNTDGDPDTCDGATAGFGANPVDHPARNGPFQGSAPGGVSINGSLTFYYNAAGEPSSAGSVQAGSRTLNVEPVTGYVH